MAFVTITNAEVAAGAAVTTALMTALRDNLLETISRGVGAPKILGVPYDYQEFLASGTWTKPANAESGDKVIIQIVAGGGSSIRTGAANDPRGGGGGGGAIWTLDDIDLLASTETVVVGAGGAAVTGTAGNDGGNSTFGTDAVKRHYFFAGGGQRGQSPASGGVGGDCYARLRGNQTDILNTEGLVDASQSNPNLMRGGSSSQNFYISSSMFGGGAGGNNDTLERGCAGGYSLYAGFGGESTSNDAGDNITDFVIDGQFPGGGGGAVATEVTGNTVSGAGANGVVRVWCIKEQ